MSDLLRLTRVKLKAAQGTRARLHAFVSAFIELQQSEQKESSSCCGRLAT